MESKEENKGVWIMNDSPRRGPRGWRRGGHCELPGREGCGHVLREAAALCRETAGDLQIPVWSFVYQGEQVK